MFHDDLVRFERWLSPDLMLISFRGTSAPSVILDVWYSQSCRATLSTKPYTHVIPDNNIANESRRLVLTSIGVPVANLMGVVSSNIFLNKDAPKYIPALATTAAFGATGIVLTLSLGAYMMIDNTRRNRKQGVKLTPKDVPTERLREGPDAPEFRWMY